MVSINDYDSDKGRNRLHIIQCCFTLISVNIFLTFLDAIYPLMTPKWMLILHPLLKKWPAELDRGKQICMMVKSSIISTRQFLRWPS